MKAWNTLTDMAELTETVLPISGDPAREYDYLQLLVSWQAIAGGIEATVQSFEERSARVRLQFVTPEIVRVQVVLDREPPASTPMLAGPRPAPPGLDVSEDEAGLSISGPALTLRVERKPFRWRLLGREGRAVAEQQVLDYTGVAIDYVSYPCGWSSVAGGPPAFHETLALRPDEALFGLGECYGQLNRRGTRSVAWSRDTHGTNTTPLTYLNVPFLWSTRGYGVFVNHASRAVYELGYPSQLSCAFRVEDPYLDEFIIYGPTPADIIRLYWQLTGQAALPPLWSFGVWMSRCMYRDAEQVHGVVERLRELGMPLDVIHVDPRWLDARKHHVRDACDFIWDRAAFGEPEEFVGWLRDRRVRLSLWENPYVWRDTEMFEEGSKRGLFVGAAGGGLAPSLDNAPEAVCLDFTNPEAARWWQDKHRQYLRAGVASFKSDYGEGVPADARFSDGTTGVQTHNVYPLLYNRAVWDVIKEENGEAVVFGRSGYAGSQRYPINWVGDTQCSFEGMAGALKAGLSLSASGIPFWAHDIGGFWNPNDRAQSPDATLYIRWAQWGLLSSHSRFHGVRGREPYWFGDEAVEIVRRYALLRYRLLPYIWSSAQETVETARPLMRPLFMEYPDDPTCQHIERQYLLGPSLLVAPVFDEDGRVRVYLPEGGWHDFWTGEVLAGPRWLDRTVPLDTMPLYVRDDSLLPLGPEMTSIGERPWRPLELQVRVSSDASLRVEGEGASLRAQARRDGDGASLELEGQAELVLRFLSPAATSADVSGGAADVVQNTASGVLTVALRLDGRARVAAR
jgi:alpha-D-xyloside xylohydrolase